jgi:hypothetical protein
MSRCYPFKRAVVPYLMGSVVLRISSNWDPDLESKRFFIYFCIRKKTGTSDIQETGSALSQTSPILVICKISLGKKSSQS